jgi:hypothetical protein
VEDRLDRRRLAAGEVDVVEVDDELRLGIALGLLDVAERDLRVDPGRVEVDVNEAVVAGLAEDDLREVSLDVVGVLAEVDVDFCPVRIRDVVLVLLACR